MPATYNNQIFRTRLEARWAAFFDLAGWKWSANPAPVGDWAPEFRVEFPCDHSECSGRHVLLVAVLPVDDVTAFRRHPALTHAYNISREALTEHDDSELHADVDAGAGFGNSPELSVWEFSHGAGGGVFDVTFFARDPYTLWEKADSLVR